MDGRPLTILPSAASPQVLSAAANEGEGLIIIGISTPYSDIRHVAREQVRQAVREALVSLLERSPEAIQLVSQPGQPLRLSPPDHHIGISVTHERGLSLAAINLSGVVGIDLMRINEQSGWQADWKCVASTYLGQQARERIAKMPPQYRANAFAQEWTRLEACLKCHGLPLSESTPSLERRLSQCRMTELSLPAGLVGTVAIMQSPKTKQKI